MFPIPSYPGECSGLILAGTYIWAHSQFGIALLVPSLVLSPSIPLGYAALNFKDLLPFNPGTALSPNRPQVLALRGLASAGAAIVGTALLNAWIRQSPSKGWERMAGNKWSGAVFVADVAGMVFAAVYVAAREEWRWRVVIPIWAAVFFVGNGAACVYVVLCTFGTTSLQEALLVGKPVVGARWPFVNTMVGEGGHYAQLDEGLDV
ncbi:uncharacterized protein EV422DRAFT_528684 [Fimicolochytrium jonesii]|uniref:uncharacterized protein n=1 Tax=Fimicolochytrium jonesii TaxID=1396493 RepID=UPI0022FE77A5|nr:uncharacterized protein EV422DRAFT_528684 [Fimicolochytrium jonesii]KAI8820998.1 hypothetical protein EV422DRAFT_528684 [Fimicolochytrium jonesii]